MTDAEKREKVIRGLELCSRTPSNRVYCHNCPYNNGISIGCMVELMKDAHALLREQEPRVIPLEELLAYPVKWEFDTPPYLCTEEKDATRMWWRTWRDTYQSITCVGTMGSNNYGKEWRVWTLQPTDKQRKAVAWDG